MKEFLKDLGIEEVNSGAYAGGWIKNPSGEEITSYNPATEEPIAKVIQAGKDDYEKVYREAEAAFEKWRMMPAPERGEIIRKLGLALREYKDKLGKLITLEMGKIYSEGKGEVQEMIDICDFAVGLSRQLYGKTMQSERPKHRMYEQWHPLGVIGIITAFNFPAAVWSWNSAIAAVCGDTMIWKPSSQTPLTSIAIQNICHNVMKDYDIEGVFNLTAGRGSVVGEELINDKRVPLISATGSCRMGRRVGEAVAKRLGRTILELGGNNGIIVLDDADLDLAVRAITFGAVGTSGQRCTTTRRLFIQKGVSEELTGRLKKAYSSVSIGDPLEESVLMGPLVNEAAVETMMEAMETIRDQGGEIIYGGSKLERTGYYVEPTLVKAHPGMEIVEEETFAPILYIFEVEDYEEAIELHNSVDQGLSSAIFTTDMISTEKFLSHKGSDCGIANVNIGTSGAEIGGAFGGEKDTGGGREAGSDAWKFYMRRQTNTINWGDEMPLAQGVEFDID